VPLTGSTEPEVQLFHAKIIKVEARGILIQGQENVWSRKERLSYPRTLWCCRVSPDKIRKHGPSNPIDDEDEDAALQVAMGGR